MQINRKIENEIEKEREKTSDFKWIVSVKRQTSCWLQNAAHNTDITFIFVSSLFQNDFNKNKRCARLIITTNKHIFAVANTFTTNSSSIQTICLLSFTVLLSLNQVFVGILFIQETGMLTYINLNANYLFWFCFFSSCLVLFHRCYALESVCKTSKAYVGCNSSWNVWMWIQLIWMSMSCRTFVTESASSTCGIFVWK